MNEKQSKKRKQEKQRNTSLLKKTIERFRTVDSLFFFYGTLVASALLIYLLIRPPAAEDITSFRLNEQAPRAVFAPFDFTYVDQIQTETKRKEAESLVAPVYTVQKERRNQTTARIQTLRESAASISKDENIPTDEWASQVLDAANFELENTEYSIDVENGDLPKTTYATLAYYRSYETFWNGLVQILKTAEGLGIADDITPLRSQKGIRYSASNARLVVGVTLLSEDGTSLVSTAVQEIRSEKEFFDVVESEIAKMFPAPVKDSPLRQFAMEIIHAAFAGPTLLYNDEVTLEKKLASREEIAEVEKTVTKGETLIGKNDLVTQEHIQKLRVMREHKKLSPLSEFGYFVLGMMFVVILIKFLQCYYPEIVVDTRKVAVIFLGIIFILGLSRIVESVSLMDLGRKTLQDAGYAVPVGALGVILTILSSARLAAFCCALTTLYLGMILNGGMDIPVLPFLLVAFITSSGAIYTVTNIRQRSDLYRAGGVAVLLASVLIIAIFLQHYKTLEQLQLHAEELKWGLIWGAVNGSLISILSIALMPIFEDFYGVTTDMRLLELSQKNDLLRRLEEEAPGSYQHSMRVSTLAESAAEAIGANALLTRVGTYYHDIGKMIKPLYFVENQQTSADKAKHSKISPNMSCLIIRNHVKSGIELAKEYNLPKVITAFIPEHHGTTLMAFFYNQALANEEVEGKVKEEDFRYPGPKPQSKETAILMLADCLEASSRTLEKCTEGEIRQLVRKMINERFMDGQFDECNLTLKDLHTLFLSFSDSLIHMLHQRIVYPERPTKDKSEENEEENGNGIGDLDSHGNFSGNESRPVV